MAFITQTQGVNFDLDEVGESPTPRNEKDELLHDLNILVSGTTQTSQGTLLLKRRKEMREVDDALDFMKDEFRSRIEACDERQAEFERKQREMMDQVSRFEKFIKENDAKKSRAENKASSEAKLRAQHEKQIKVLKEEFLDLKKDLSKLGGRVKCHTRYQDYLEDVVELADGEFHGIPDVLNRHQTLEGANEDLRNLVESVESESDKLGALLVQCRRDAQNAVLVMNSEIHGHQKRLETLRGVTFKTDIDREQGDRSAKDRKRESAQVVNSIKNLYARCVSSMISKAAKPSIEGAGLDTLSEGLKLIESRIIDLADIVECFASSEVSSSESASVLLFDD